MSPTLREGTPTEAGLSASQLDIARDVAARAVAEGVHPAVVVLVARHGVIALHEAFGVLGPEPDDPPLPRDALFPMASASKPLTATALMVLVEEGRVGLTRPVREYIPEFDGDGKDTVYVHHLLTHTSGVESPTDPDEFGAEMLRRIRAPRRDPALHAFVDALLQLAYERPLRKPPGEEMFYDGNNYELVGEIVRRVSGRSLPEFVRERIFEPLGMDDSSVTLRDEHRDRAVRAVSESTFNATLWASPPEYMPSSPSGAGVGTYSTALDMATFAQAFLDGGRGANGRILGPATVREMLTNQIPGIPGVLLEERHDEASWSYGWGIVCSREVGVLPDASRGHVPARRCHGRVRVGRSRPRSGRRLLRREREGHRARPAVVERRPVRERGHRRDRRLRMHRPLRDGSAAEAALSQTRLDVARDVAARAVAESVHPALVVLVASHGVIALHEAFGRLGPEPDDPPLPRDALFPLASLQKPITATALMVLVDEGRVGLTRPVREYIPEFDGDGKDKVYVHHLLTHTSGLCAQQYLDEFRSEMARRLAVPPQNSAVHPFVDAMLQIACQGPLRARTGDEMRYDALNYELLGEIVRRVAARPLHEFVRERVFEPLDMRDSHLIVPPELRERAVRLAAWPDPMFDVASGAGAGTYATALDSALFGQAFLDGGRGANGRILGPATVREMTKNQIPGTPGALLAEWHREASWGYGWGMACHEKWEYFPTHAPGTFMHGGATGVYLWCDPVHDLVGVWFAAGKAVLEADTLLENTDLFVNAVTAAIED